MDAPRTRTETFLHAWPTLAAGLDEADPSATIRPSVDDGLDDVRFARVPRPASAEALTDPGDTLGEGGMGRVRTAVQATMGRRVAVKSSRSEGAPPGVVRRSVSSSQNTAL